MNRRRAVLPWLSAPDRLSSATLKTLSLPLAFAAGAVLATLADAIMPEAYEHAVLPWR
jgi:high-affinity nickel permease